MKTILSVLAEIYHAFVEVFTPRLLTPEDCKINVPNWQSKDIQPRKVPTIKSTAKRLPGEAEAYEWSDLSTVSNVGNLTPSDWGAVSEVKATSDARLAAFVKAERANGQTYAQITVAARQRLDMKVSLSTVEKIGAALSRAGGGVDAD